jgi:hypothetical protein
VVHEFVLQRAEEALDDRIVVGHTLAAHALPDPARGQGFFEFTARVLASLVGRAPSE